jgi:hypothetical protein
MTVVSRSPRQVADLVGRLLTRTAAVIIGFIMMAVGLGMMATVVMLPAGVVIGLLGIAMIVGGLFAPDMRSGQRGGQ